MSSGPTPRRPGRVGQALLATLLGVVVLPVGGQGTWSRWAHQDEVAAGTLTAGALDLGVPVTSIALHSRQPVGSRDLVSGDGCAVRPAYTSCTVVTDTLPAERLVPGDTLTVTSTFTVSGSGANLAGDLTVDARQVLDQGAGADALATASTVSVSVTAPDAVTTALPGLVGALPLDLDAGQGFGSYVVEVSIETPVADAGSPWGTNRWSESLDLGSLELDVSQAV